VTENSAYAVDIFACLRAQILFPLSGLLVPQPLHLVSLYIHEYAWCSN